MLPALLGGVLRGERQSRGAEKKGLETPVSHSRCRFEDHYELRQQVLGTGVCGSVREAVCKQTGCAVAVKSFDKRRMRHKLLTSMRSELEIHSCLAHPSIVKLEASYETEHEVHMVMEKLAGGELFARLVQRGRFRERDAGGIVLQVLQVLAYLHSQNIVHRDVKPENIMYCERDGSNVALIDFGFAVRLEPGTKVRQRCGSLQYVAPEVLSGSEYNEKADVWSLGSVMYSLLTGEVLFDGSTQDQVYRQNVSGQISFSRRFRRLPQDAQDLVRKLLSVDPDARPSAQEALEHPWLQRLAAESKEQPNLRLRDASKLLSSAFRLIGMICE